MDSLTLSQNKTCDLESFITDVSNQIAQRFTLCIETITSYNKENKKLNIETIYKDILAASISKHRGVFESILMNNPEKYVYVLTLYIIISGLTDDQIQRLFLKNPCDISKYNRIITKIKLLSRGCDGEIYMDVVSKSICDVGTLAEKIFMLVCANSYASVINAGMSYQNVYYEVIISELAAIITNYQQ
jgi:hypothetical protein